METVTAPTVWEQGRWSGDRVTRLSVLACLLTAGFNLVVTHHLGWIFDIAFVLTCIGGALAVHPRDFFRIGVLPPLLMLGCALTFSGVARTAVAEKGDGFVQGTISALAHRSGALLAGYLLALAVLAIRTRRMAVLRARAQRAAQATSKREVSPAPRLVISGDPEEKSTTVVGDGSTSPESTTASSW